MPVNSKGGKREKKGLLEEDDIPHTGRAGIKTGQIRKKARKFPAMFHSGLRGRSRNNA